MSALTYLFVGRFQPFHNGHLLVIKGMTKVCGRIIIAIGSSDKKGTMDNPFSVDERKEMIQGALQDADIIPSFDISFIEVPDMKEDAAWTEKVLELAGTVHAVWTGNEVMKKCFEAKGIEVKTIKPVPGISGTEIRRRMKASEPWQSLVPEAVAQSISMIKGADRVRAIS